MPGAQRTVQQAAPAPAPAPAPSPNQYQNQYQYQTNAGAASQYQQQAYTQSYNQAYAAPQAQAQTAAFDLKELLKAIILALMGTFCVLTFCFSLIAYAQGRASDAVSGFSALFGGLGDTDSSYGGWIVIAVIFLWMIFLLSLGVLALTVINLIGVIIRRPIIKLPGGIFKLTVIGAGIVTTVYLIIGSIISIVANSIYMDYYGYSYFFNSYPRLFTASYWPLIIEALLLGGYIVVSKVVPSQPVEAKAAAQAAGQPYQAAPAAAPRRRNVNAVEEIKKYKELYDMGAITWEEFEAKKKELL